MGIKSLISVVLADLAEIKRDVKESKAALERSAENAEKSAGYAKEARDHVATMIRLRLREVGANPGDPSRRPARS
jgi:hypothetical protein